MYLHGLGKPEPLKENLSGYWSRRIDEVNRLVYKVYNDQIEIIQCKGHYQWVWTLDSIKGLCQVGKEPFCLTKSDKVTLFFS